MGNLRNSFKEKRHLFRKNHSIFRIKIIFSSKMKLFLLSVLLTILLVMVIAEPLPDKDDDDDSETTAEPEKAAAEPENNAMSTSQAKILTSFASFIAIMLFR